MKNSIQINLEEAPKFIAGLVREGVTFEARQDGIHMIVTMTGGF